MLVANLGPQQVAGQMGGLLLRQTAKVPQCRGIHVASPAGKRKSPPLAPRFVPAGEDAGTLSGKLLQRSWRPTARSCKALDAAEALYGDTPRSRDQLPAARGEICFFTQQNEVVNHTPECRSSIAKVEAELGAQLKLVLGKSKNVHLSSAEAGGLVCAICIGSCPFDLIEVTRKKVFT